MKSQQHPLCARCIRGRTGSVGAPASPSEPEGSAGQSVAELWHPCSIPEQELQGKYWGGGNQSVCTHHTHPDWVTTSLFLILRPGKHKGLSRYFLPEHSDFTVLTLFLYLYLHVFSVMQFLTFKGPLLTGTGHFIRTHHVFQELLQSSPDLDTAHTESLEVAGGNPVHTRGSLRWWQQTRPCPLGLQWCHKRMAVCYAASVPNTVHQEPNDINDVNWTNSKGLCKETLPTAQPERPWTFPGWNSLVDRAVFVLKTILSL